MFHCHRQGRLPGVQCAYVLLLTMISRNPGCDHGTRLRYLLDRYWTSASLNVHMMRINALPIRLLPHLG